MTAADLTLIAILVDRSGSMASCRTDMEGGINTMITEQANQPGLLNITLAQFDTQYERLWPIGRVTADNTPHYTLTPRGNTALLDGMGRFITEIGEELAALPEDQRPGKVIMFVVTDGHENASADWTKDKVQALVHQQKHGYQWEFIFLGANIDAVREGASLGVGAAASLTFNAGDSAAVSRSYSMASAGMSSYRQTGDSVNFTDTDRKKAMGTNGDED